LQLARGQGLQDALKERFLRAYFTESEPIGEEDVLVRLAGGVGVEGAAEALASGAYVEAVRADEREARLLGIKAVPFFVVDRYYGVEGAQPAELILQALDAARDAARAATA
jgi:predicted DsbA family dithiol-disulfide isomerase